ncbi:hypothetical protein EMCRGX_G014947 [Ephydatia muelleri]
MASKIIYFGHITSYGESGFNSSGAVPAVELAVEHVNNNTSILAGYKLVSTPVMDSECDRIKSLDAFFSSVVYATSRYNVIALLGCGCGVATEPVAEISHRWNITQVSYASGSSSLSNRAQFKNYFRIWPSFKDIAPGLVSILKHYNWTRVSFLTQKENLFTSDSQYGLTAHYYISACFQKDTPSYYWLILLMTYTAFLQCLGMILAFQTRKVKVSALNSCCHYISSITLLTLLFTHFGFYNYVNISHGVLNGVIFINTTAYLGLIFCPKMISLYKDPNGSKVFRKSFSGVQDLSDKEGEIAMSTAKNIMESLQMKEPRSDTDGAS